MGGTGTLVRYTVDLVPTLFKTIQGFMAANAFISDNSLLSQVHCNHCAPTYLLPLTLLRRTPVQVIRVGRKQDAILNRAAGFQVSQGDPQRKSVPD